MAECRTNQVGCRRGRRLAVGFDLGSHVVWYECSFYLVTGWWYSWCWESDTEPATRWSGMGAKARSS